MAQVTIKFAAAAGFNGGYRDGLYWPATGTEVNLIDSDENAPDVDGVRQIGRKTEAALRADARFSFDSAASAAEISAKLAEHASVVAQLAAEREKTAALERQVAELTAKLEGKKGK